MKEKSEEVIKCYHVKSNFSHFNYYYRSHSFVTYLGSVRLQHFHQIKISDNFTLESGITKSWGTTPVPGEIQRYLKGEFLGDEKVVEISERAFSEVYKRVLKFMNEWGEYPTK